MTLQNFDTFFAFVAIMAGVSLVVTAINQFFSSFLGLRGKVLLSGLRTLFENLDPDLRQHAKLLGREVLTHPLISDSSLIRLHQGSEYDVPAWLPKACQKTIKDFQSWLSKVWSWIPCLRHWPLANAIRADELVLILHRLADDFWADPESRQKLHAVLDALSGSADKNFSSAVADLKAAGDDWRELARVTAKHAAVLLNQLPTVRDNLSKSSSDLRSFFDYFAAILQLGRTLGRSGNPTGTEQIERVRVLWGDTVRLAQSLKAPALDQIQPLLSSHLSNATVSIRAWFDHAMDRTSQAFLVRMRLWTVIFSTLIVLAFQLDSLRLIKTLSRDAELRSRIVSSSEALQQKADDMNVGSTNPPARIYTAALEQFIGNRTNLFANPTAALTNWTLATNWLAAQVVVANQRLASSNPPVAPFELAAVVQQYGEILPQAQLRIAADNLQRLLNSDLILQIIPPDYPVSARDWIHRFGDWKHSVGVAISVILLSLGAPFWFNMLKTLSNLRPIVASRQKAEAQAG